MTLYLFQYNNYYNRIVKRLETIEEYEEATTTSIPPVANVNFNPNDGISTNQVVNINGSVIPDYAILVDDANNIVSRWYVLEAARTRSGQYNLDLYRDVIADWYDKIVSAPMFVEKATLTRNDPRIFNNEAMTFNKIKTSETLLKDASKVPWIVGYIAKNTTDENISVPAADVEIDYELTSLNGYQYHQYTYENPYVMSYNDFTAKMYLHDPQGGRFQVGWDTWGYPKMPTQEIPSSPPPDGPTNFPPNGTYCTFKAGPKIKSIFVYLGDVFRQVSDHTYGKDWIGPSYETTRMPRNPMDLSDEDGKIIKVGLEYYRIKYNTRITSTRVASVSSASQYGQMFMNVINRCDKLDANNIIEPVGAVEYRANVCYFEYEPITLESISVDIKSNRAKCVDAPYDIFAIPYGSIKFSNFTGTAPTTNKEAGLALAQAFSTTLGSNLYDIQLLPYCPAPLWNKGVNMLNKREHIDYEWIKKTDNSIISIMFWIRNASFQRGIEGSIIMPEDALNFKVANECDTYRIVSPTYNGEFEFSAAKNEGVASFIAMCTYRPFNPFIKVAPVFKGLYGQEFKDGRGCICQGDFSLPQINDAWEMYQVNNKNYLNSFNRQIQNMEVNNAVQRELERYNILGGTLQGAGTGAAAGMMSSGVYGGIAGGLAGGAFSSWAGEKDRQLAEKLRLEALDYTKDQFGYQLGNIAALPYTLANVGAQTHISKYFPMLEYYTCTETEKQALRDKIKYNGMTVETIGTIQEFLQNERTYIKGKLIRLEDAEEEFHFVKTIADELYKGVFI